MGERPASSGGRTAAAEPGERLSFAQECLWFLHQIEPDSSVYNVPLAWRVRGRLYRQALQNAPSAVVFRHEALRTTFHEVDGCPYQQAADAKTVPLSEVDLRPLSPRQREQALQQELHNPNFAQRMLQSVEEMTAYFCGIIHEQRRGTPSMD